PGRRSAFRRSLRAFLLRLLRGRGSVAAIDSRRVSVRLRPRGTRLARRFAHRPANAFPAGAVDLPQPMAHPLSQFRRGFAGARTGFPAPSRSGARAETGVERSGSSTSRLAGAPVAGLAVESGRRTSVRLALSAQRRRGRLRIFDTEGRLAPVA